MTSSNKSHIQPAKNRDPAEAGRDPEQLTAEGKHGTSYALYEDTQKAQVGGERNDRVTEFSVNAHNTEPINAPSPSSYEKGSAEGAQGISNHALSEELAEQKKLADDTEQKRPAAAKV